MRKKYLLGANNDKELVFGEFEISHRNGYPEFSASFDTVRPFKGSDIDLVDYFSDFVEDCGKEYAYDLCERFGCSPQDLPQALADECSDPRDALDCSLYPETYEINDEDWYFESGSCGQHDTRDEMEEYVNKEAYDLLIYLWDNYHLGELDYSALQDVNEKIDKIESRLADVDEDEWIIDYIRRNF